MSLNPNFGSFQKMCVLQGVLLAVFGPRSKLVDLGNILKRKLKTPLRSWNHVITLTNRTVYEQRKGSSRVIWPKNG